MGRRTNQNKPQQVVLGPYRARAVRGPNSDGRWYWRVEQNRVPDGCHWSTREEMELELARRVTGVSADAAAPETDKPKTLRQLLSRWLAIQTQRTDIESDTIVSFEKCAARLTTAAGSWPIAQVPQRVHELRNRPLAKSTLNQDLKILRRVWRWGQDLDFCDRQLPKVRVSGAPPRRSTPTTEQALQVEALLPPNLRLAHAILRVTGCRGIAIRRLAWADVDLEHGILALVGKGRRVREVPIPNSLVSALGTYERQGDRVFQISVIAMLRIRVQEVCKAIGVPPYPLHGLRRLRVREYRRASVPVRVAADLLGHSPQVMLEMYDKASKEDKRAALTKLWETEDEPTI